MFQLFDNRGFTFIELVIIIVIIGIMALIAIPNFTASGGMKLSGAATMIQTDLRYVQELAMSTNTNCGIIFDVSGNNYRAYQGDDINNTAVSPLTGSAFLVDFDELSQFKGVNIYSVNLGGSNIIEFDRLGRPFMVDGATPISGPNNIITLNASGLTKDLTITTNTGIVTIN